MSITFILPKEKLLSAAASAIEGFLSLGFGFQTAESGAALARGYHADSETVRTQVSAWQTLRELLSSRQFDRFNVSLYKQYARLRIPEQSVLLTFEWENKIVDVFRRLNGNGQSILRFSISQVLEHDEVAIPSKEELAMDSFAASKHLAIGYFGDVVEGCRKFVRACGPTYGFGREFSPGEIDSRFPSYESLVGQLPNHLFRFNYWNPEVVRILGRERILSIPKLDTSKIVGASGGPLWVVEEFPLGGVMVYLDASPMYCDLVSDSIGSRLGLKGDEEFNGVDLGLSVLDR